MALLTVAGALLWATGIRAQVAITDIAVRSNVVTLDWAASTDLCLVAVSTSLCSGLFTYVGDVLATNGARLTDAGEQVWRIGTIEAGPRGVSI